LLERDARIRTLETELASAVSTRLDISHSPELRQRDLEIDRLKTYCDTLERRLRTEGKRADAAEARLAAVKQRPMLRSEPLPAPTTGDPAGDEDLSDFAGYALLYVGGYRDVTARLPAHVEAMGGVFLYHDGGIERQNRKLRGLVSQADAVFCPVNCVSHDACLRLKHLCKLQGKRFVLLRSAGFPAFVSALGEFAKPAPRNRLIADPSHGGELETPEMPP
jgi:Uncharacterized protein conserved in bacteria (DUF2325)